MDLLTEIRIPTRAAPRPPGSNAAAPVPPQKGSNISSNVWGNSNDFFGSTLKVTQKKKPPPRPPPPKFPPKFQSHGLEKPKKPARPTELLSNLFGRTKHKQAQQQQQPPTTYGSSYFNSRTTSSLSSTSNLTSSSTNIAFSSSKANNDGTTSFSLIDLSPPGSPTFTTRSSSDGVSVDSFGSDGNSNPSAFTTSSGSTSQTESAFEDDFDFFGNIQTGGKKQSDPWRVSCSQDPFGSFEQASSKTSLQQWPPTTSQQQTTHIKEIGESNFFVFNDATSTTASSSASGSPFDSPSRQFNMPTIIRPKKTKKDSSRNENKITKSNVYQSSASSNNYAAAPRFTPAVGLIEEKSLCWDNDDNEATGSSPPMPKQPPPPPPPEYIAGLEDGLMNNPARPPYGIALYDFPASQAGDLKLKEGDVVQLTKLINDSWMEGRVGNREGMFPINFVDVKIPLPGLETNTVNALYAFKAETSDDLTFEEGARIKVLSRISDDWLYGEYEGKKGQFPAAFVDKVPNDLPNHL